MIQPLGWQSLYFLNGNPSGVIGLWFIFWPMKWKLYRTRVLSIFNFHQNIHNMWCDQAKSVWSRSNLVFIFLTNYMHHFQSYILKKTPLKSVNWFQRYERLKDAKNKRKQKTFSALFSSIFKSIFPTSDWFCLITSHMVCVYNFCKQIELPVSVHLQHSKHIIIKFIPNYYFLKIKN